jgi:hypothetical protein
MARTRTRAAQREAVNIGGSRSAPEYPARITVSEATRQDLVRHGEVVHAGTGLMLRVGDDGVVAAWHRGTGEQTDTEVRCPRVDWTPED